MDSMYLEQYTNIVQSILLFVIIVYLLFTIGVIVYIYLEEDETRRDNIKFVFSSLFGNNMIFTMGILVLLYIVVPSIFYGYDFSIKSIDTAIKAQATSSVLSKILSSLKIIK
jgi:CHASE3 domain sensor protein